MNEINYVQLGEDLVKVLPSLISVYQQLRAQAKDGSLPPVEDLLTKADATNDSVIGIADAEIAKYKK